LCTYYDDRATAAALLILKLADLEVAEEELARTAYKEAFPW
jgi:hypothetical protein